MLINGLTKFILIYRTKPFIIYSVAKIALILKKKNKF